MGSASCLCHFKQVRKCYEGVLQYLGLALEKRKAGEAPPSHTNLLLSYSVTAIGEKMYKLERKNTA